ncbi:hypothetical protein WN944_017810 [Citrus x changshan-huyou]|uniref:Uncharacterized protein n=1 Tax=Citrus x changshan-huyou TaxID=2935761 RepID=A0AAP0MBY4_9ROSI
MCFPLKNGHVLEKVTIKWGLYLENPAEIISKILEFSRSSTDIPGALVIVIQNVFNPEDVRIGLNLRVILEMIKNISLPILKFHWMPMFRPAAQWPVVATT